MKVKQLRYHENSSRIVSDQQLRTMKISYLQKRGFRQVENSWTNGSRRIRLSWLNDADTPLSVFINIVDQTLQAAAEAKERAKAKAKQKAKTNKGNKQRLDHEHMKTDAMDYRLPGSYGSGKRR